MSFPRYPEYKDSGVVGRLAGTLECSCPIPCDYIPIRSCPLFEARLLLPAFLSMLQQESKA